MDRINADAHFARAIAHAKTNDDAGTWAEFEAALACDPDHLPTLVHMSDFLRQRGFAHQGMDLALRATRVQPSSVAAWTALGWCALDAHRLQGALHAFGEAVRLAPGDASSLAALARAQSVTADFEGAELSLRKALKQQPANRSIALELAMRLRQQGRSQDALEMLDTLPLDARTAPAALEMRAGALADLDRTDEALQQARSLVSAHPANPASLALLSQIEWEYGGGLDAANDVHARAARAHPDDLSLALGRISFLQASRQHEEALQALDALRQRDPENVDLDLSRAYSLDELGDHAGASVFYARLEARHGGRVSFLNHWTRNRLRARDPRGAEQLAQRAIALDPDNQEAMAYLGTSWRLLDDPRERLLCDEERFIAVIDAGTRNPLLFSRLREALEDLHRARRAPMQQSVRGGQQTTGRLFASHRAEAIRNLRPLLLELAREWLATLPVDTAHPFLRRNNGKVVMTGSWSVRLASGGNHVNHIHNEGWISSALYISLPPVMQHDDGTHAGWLQFGQPPIELGLDLPPRRLIRPEAGKLVLFPSYFWHGTLPFTDTEPRLTVAYDMVPDRR